MSDSDQSPGIRLTITKGRVGKPKDINNRFLKPSNIWTGNETATRLVTYLSCIGKINKEKQVQNSNNIITQRSSILQKNKVIQSLIKYFGVHSQGVLSFFLRRVSLNPDFISGLPYCPNNMAIISLSNNQALKLTMHLFDKQFQEELNGYIRNNRPVKMIKTRILDQEQVVQCALAHYLIDQNKTITDQAFTELTPEEVQQIESAANTYISNILNILNDGTQYQSYNQQEGQLIAMAYSEDQSVNVMEFHDEFNL